MAETQYTWPAPSDAKLIGKSHDRLDGLAKATGAAKYTYDVNLPDQLIVKALGSPHAHCRVKEVDVRDAEKVPGVVHVHVLRAPSKDDKGQTVLAEIMCQGELIAAVAAETEAAAAEGVAKLRVEYELLDVFTQDHDLAAAQAANRTADGGLNTKLERKIPENVDEDSFESEEIERLLKESKHVVEGHYGIDAITHCCLEPHGSTVQWKGNKLDAYLSTQNVSQTDDGFAGGLKIAASDVDVHCEYVGGGFGSKFAPDYWGIAAAEIAKKTGRPVKFMLDRHQELQLGGNRPSAYIQVRLGADAEGIVQVWDSHHWGTSGYTGGGVSAGAIPYVYLPRNHRRRATSIRSNTDRARAWRAPNHPQACAISQTAYDDLAAKMGADSLDIFRKNLVNIASPQKAEVYLEEMRIAAELIDWRAKWHPHGQGTRQGAIVEGLGMGIHQWGGTANNSSCLVRVYPDGAVESFCGTQDLGTGTRTVCGLVLAETLGLPLSAVKANIGHSTYPNSGASGGSTTVGGVAESHRRAGLDLLQKLFERVAPKLNTAADQLAARDGRIVLKENPNKGLSWKEACALLEMKPLEVTATYEKGKPTSLSSEGVGGVQMAHVAVDTETGAIRIQKFVAVQDMGRIINRKTAESQIYGAVIMAIAYSLFEQRITDPKTGLFLNSGMADYKLPRLGDIGPIVVHLYEPESEQQRGVIGLGEPPVISGGAAISNAVCNALGVRVPVLPLTPQRVLEALQKAKA